MKINKQTILFLILIFIAIASYLIFPQFEREDFSTENVEEISSGIKKASTTTTSISEEVGQENNTPEEQEIFEESIYDTLLINNKTTRIDEIFNAYLIIGSDQRSKTTSLNRGFVEGSRADVIMIVLLDKNSVPSIVSLPRDLLIKDPCTEKIQRINSSFQKNDCGTAAENLSAVILNITGLKINHFVKFNFEGFENIIDSFGGIEICVEKTQREGYSFEIQKGCNILSGEIALNWVVSRNTEILVGEKIIDSNGDDISEWMPMAGVSDLTRVKKQQQVTLSLMKELSSFGSFNEFLKFVNALEGAFTIDQNISVLQASELLWSFRNIDFESIKKLTVPTFNYQTENNAQVLILDKIFYEFLTDTGVVDE
jgi:LCP family protein required for cell wall assembly